MFHIFDFYIRSELGHFYEYDLAIVQELHSRNIRANLYVPTLASSQILNDLNAIPLFRSLSKYYGIAKTLPSILAKVYSSLYETIMVFNDLKSINHNTFSKEDFILIPTLNHRQFLSVVWWFKTIPKDLRPHLILLFHVEENLSLRKCLLCPAIFYRIIFLLIDKSNDLGIIIATYSEELSYCYQSLTRKTIKTLPIPYVKKNRVCSEKKKSGTLVSYLGEARVEKGFHLLPLAIECVLSMQNFKNVHFLIQVISHEHNDELLIKKTKTKLRLLSKNHDNIQLIERSLTGEEYQDFLSNSDILLLPYSQKAYQSRTSGIFAEGMGLGKLMVVPEKTWMHKQILQYGGIAMEFESENSSSLADAIRNSITYFEKRDHDILSAASERWNSFHNSKNFIDLLIGMS